MWRGLSCTLVAYQDIVLSDGKTRKSCAVIHVHGAGIEKATRFVDAAELST